jgi:large subunit ribosomal protein L6
LQLKGTGYKLYQIGRILVLKWGFSHLIALRLPTPLNIKIDRSILKLESIDFYLLKQVSHILKKLRKLDLYKGKGLYEPDLELRLKLGKV